MAKSKYESHVKDKLILVEGWARDGLIDEDIAKKLGISIQSFYTYKSKFVEFFEALKRGKEVADYEVENALFRRALGYDYDEIKTGPMGVTETKKHVPPDVGAIAFWLKNRRPDKWRDKRILEHEGEIKTGNPYEGLTTEELRGLIKNDK